MAIALLPLKEGETLASNIGRYAEMMGLKSTLGLRQSLFGGYPYRGARLPGSINYLAEQTRDYWNLKPEEIVSGHTEYRYLTMMAAPPIREKIFRRMLESSASNDLPIWVSGLIGERTSTFRYCDECLKEAIESREAPCWRVDHQLAGVYCCVKHSRVLKSARKVPGCQVDQTVMRLVHASDEAVLHNLAPTEKRAIEDIARRSVRQGADGNPGKSVKEYQDLLREVGFVRENSRLHHIQAISAWFDYFGRAYCYLTNTNANRISVWLDHVSRGTWGCECPHPFMFIAAESLLEHLAELPGSYFPQNLGKDRRLSGEEEMARSVVAAYACKGSLHRSSDTFKFASTRTGRWKLVCTCGLSYRMMKRDHGDAEQLTPLSYGARYRKRFFSLMDKGMSVYAAARELHVNHACAYFWAERAGAASVRNLPSGEVRRLRARWCRLVRNTVSKTRIRSAMEADPVTYKTLLKFDRDWLRTFNLHHRSPPRANLVNPNEPTADEIREAQRALILVEPPVMASRSAILERVGCPRACNRSRPYWDVLVEVTECRLAYLERVIAWLSTLASRQRLGDCDEALRSAGLRRQRFSVEQRERIRVIELRNEAGDRSSQKR